MSGEWRVVSGEKAVCEGGLGVSSLATRHSLLATLAFAVAPANGRGL